MNKISPDTRLAAGLKLGIWGQGSMDIGSRKVKEKQLIVVAPDKFHRLGCLDQRNFFVLSLGGDFVKFLPLFPIHSQSFIQQQRVDKTLWKWVPIIGKDRLPPTGVSQLNPFFRSASHHPVIFHVDKGGPIVAGRYTEIVVEAHLQRSRLQLPIPVRLVLAKAKIPLADTSHAIARRLEQGRHRRASDFDQQGFISLADKSFQATPPAITPSQDSIAGGRTHRRWRMGIGKAYSFASQTIDVGVWTRVAP